VVGSMARLPAHAQGTPCHPSEEWQVGNGKTPSAHGPDGALSHQLQEGNDCLRPASRHVRVEAVMERGPCPEHHRQGRRTPAAGQPGGAGDDGLLPDNQPGSPLDGV